MFPSILTFDFDIVLGHFSFLGGPNGLFLGSFLFFGGPNELFLGSGYSSRTVLGSTHVVEQLSFSMIPSIPSFEFDLILGSFFTFWAPNAQFWGSFLIFLGPNGLFLGSGSTYVFEQSLSSMASLILTFDFDLILGSFLNFWGLNGLFLGLWKGLKTFSGSTHVV